MNGFLIAGEEMRLLWTRSGRCGTINPAAGTQFLLQSLHFHPKANLLHALSLALDCGLAGGVGEGGLGGGQGEGERQSEKRERRTKDRSGRDEMALKYVSLTRADTTAATHPLTRAPCILRPTSFSATLPPCASLRATRLPQPPAPLVARPSPNIPESPPPPRR